MTGVIMKCAKLPFTRLLVKHLPDEFLITNMIGRLPLPPEAQVVIANALANAAKERNVSFGELLVSDEALELLESLMKFFPGFGSTTPKPDSQGVMEKESHLPVGRKSAKKANGRDSIIVEED